MRLKVQDSSSRSGLCPPHLLDLLVDRSSADFGSFESRVEPLHLSALKCSPTKLELPCSLYNKDSIRQAAYLEGEPGM